MRGFEKILFDPSDVLMRFSETVPGRACAIKKILFAGFPFLTPK
jgi:hypothetical protein